MAETPTRSGPVALTAASATIKAAGAASTWVLVRSIIVVNTTSGVLTLTVGVGTSNADAEAKRIADALTVNAHETVELIAPGFLTLLGGATPDLLYALGSAAGLTLTASHVEGP